MQCMTILHTAERLDEDETEGEREIKTSLVFIPKMNKKK